MSNDYGAKGQKYKEFHTKKKKNWPQHTLLIFFLILASIINTVYDVKLTILFS